MSSCFYETTVMASLVSYLLFTTALIAAKAVKAQIPLPKHPLGFVYNEGELSAPIHLEAFVDLTCPDSQQAWPNIKKVADMYGPKTVQLTLQLFPLPYHTNAFLAAQVSSENMDTYYSRLYITPVM